MQNSSETKNMLLRLLASLPKDATAVLTASLIETPFGQMIAIADEQALYLLEFVECPAVERKLKRLKTRIIPGRTQPIAMIEHELREYSAGTLQTFKTPHVLRGTPFQQSVWRQLEKIPYGKTCSYAELAAVLGKPSAFRAVAQANARNTLCIMIPCHRVINSSGALGGYASGVVRKQWLLDHEKKDN